MNNQGAGKLYFGRGTKLTVETGNMMIFITQFHPVLIEKFVCVLM